MPTYTHFDLCFVIWGNCNSSLLLDS